MHVPLKPQRRHDTPLEERDRGTDGDLDGGYEDLNHGRVPLTKNPHHKKSSKVAEALVVSLPGRHTFTARKENKRSKKLFAGVSGGFDEPKFREKRAKKEVRTPPIPPLRGVICKLFRKEQYGFTLEEAAAKCTFTRMPCKG